MAEHETFKALVEADRMELLLRYPFLGRVICQCELVPVKLPNAPVACNDCRRIYLSQAAYMALSACLNTFSTEEASPPNTAMPQEAEYFSHAFEVTFE